MHLDHRDTKGLTALHHAVIRDCKITSRHLIEAGASIDEKDEYGATPLYHAVKKQHQQIAKLLLDNKVSSPASHQILVSLL